MTFAHTVTMKLSLAPLATAFGALLAVGCAAASAPTETSEDDLRKKAFGYTCTTSDARVLEDAARIEIAVADGVFRFTDGFGPNLGARDRSYRAPKGTSRARYDGFEYGGDCALRLVVDASALTGGATPVLRVQCEGDDFTQDVYQCSGPRPARIEVPPPAPPAPPPAPPSPPLGARRWSCAAQGALVLTDRLTLQVDAAGMRLVADDLTYEGTRDDGYRSRSGAYVAYDDFGYGGDCSMSAVVEEKILQSSASSATLKVRCKGDDFAQDSYACKPE